MREILGNETLIEHFVSSVRQGKVSHAYILEGEKGSGKKTAANAFARLLQCGQKEKKRFTASCDECESCIMMDHRSHPDVIWVSHEKPGVISVGEIREQLVNTIDVKPYKGPYKIYIIDDAEKMNQAAQNAILKTMEEPPEYAVILLLAENRGAFLPTILSRCILLAMKPVSDDIVREYLLKNCGVSEDTADFCVGFSMGNIGKAKEAAVSEDFFEMKDQALSVLRKFHEAEDYEIIQTVKVIKKWKDNIHDYLDILLIWYRDILILKTLKDKRYLIFRKEYIHLKKQCDILKYEDINEIFDKIEQAGKRIKANVNFDTTLELLHIEIRRKYCMQEG